MEEKAYFMFLLKPTLKLLQEREKMAM